MYAPSSWVSGLKIFLKIGENNLVVLFFSICIVLSHSSNSGTPVACMLGCLLLSHKPLILCWIFFKYFSLSTAILIASIHLQSSIVLSSLVSKFFLSPSNENFYIKYCLIIKSVLHSILLFISLYDIPHCLLKHFPIIIDIVKIFVLKVSVC